MKEKVKITEVGARDGLQNEKAFIPTNVKITFIKKLIEASLTHIELTSFVKPSSIPQLADASEVSAHFVRKSISQEFSCLTPNLHGYKSAIEHGYKEVAVFTAASNSFSRKNINKTIEESLHAFDEIFLEASKNNVKVRGYVSTIIACPYEGWIDPDKVLGVIDRLLDKGVYEVSLGETIGKAIPSQVEKLLNLILKKHPAKLFAGHFHDTYGMGIANTSKSLEMGLRSFDSSSGGLGGCPYAKGASGNLATEDLLYLLDTHGYDTGVDLNKIVEASQYIESFLGRKLMSKSYQALLASKI